MKATIRRLNSTQVDIIMENDRDIHVVEQIPHIPGLIEQANLWVAEQAVRWNEEKVDVYASDGDFTHRMWTMAKKAYPVRSILAIHDLSELKDDQPEEDTSLVEQE